MIFPLMALSVCVDPYKDIKKKLNDPKQSEYIVTRSDLNQDKKEDMILINKISCGNRGCENYIYTLNKKSCYHYSGLFFGRLEMDKKKGLLLKQEENKSIRLSFNKKTYQFEEMK